MIDTKHLRDVAEAATCDKCDGEGQRGYADTTCGGRGAGGQMITVGACRDCRGLGVNLSFRDAWSPSTAIEVLDEIDALKYVIRENDRSHNQTAQTWLDETTVLRAELDTANKRIAELESTLAAALLQRDNLETSKNIDLKHAYAESEGLRTRCAELTEALNGACELAVHLNVNHTAYSQVYAETIDALRAIAQGGGR